jgi:hypothetical protein
MRMNKCFITQNNWKYESRKDSKKEGKDSKKDGKLKPANSIKVCIKDIYIYVYKLNKEMNLLLLYRLDISYVKNIARYTSKKTPFICLYIYIYLLFYEGNGSVS